MKKKKKKASQKVLRRRHNYWFRFLPIPDEPTVTRRCAFYTCVFSTVTCHYPPPPQNPPWRCTNTSGASCFARRQQIVKRDVIARKCPDKQGARGGTITPPCFIRRRTGDDCEMQGGQFVATCAMTIINVCRGKRGDFQKTEGPKYD